jgi:hypothetical protein
MSDRKKARVKIQKNVAIVTGRNSSKLPLSTCGENVRTVPQASATKRSREVGISLRFL